MDYIRHQYYYYGFGLYGIYLKHDLTFLGITGFSLTDIPEADAEVSYALLEKYQHQGYAREAVTSLLMSSHIHRPDHLIARISPKNQSSVDLAQELGIPLLLDG
jgi:RimJ/RimL family protein N-acetyltransferase